MSSSSRRVRLSNVAEGSVVSLIAMVNPDHRHLFAKAVERLSTEEAKRVARQLLQTAEAQQDDLAQNTAHELTRWGKGLQVQNAVVGSPTRQRKKQ